MNVISENSKYDAATPPYNPSFVGYPLVSDDPFYGQAAPSPDVRAYAIDPYGAFAARSGFRAQTTCNADVANYCANGGPFGQGVALCECVMCCYFNCYQTLNGISLSSLDTFGQITGLRQSNGVWACPGAGGCGTQPGNCVASGCGACSSGCPNGTCGSGLSCIGGVCQGGTTGGGLSTQTILLIGVAGLLGVALVVALEGPKQQTHSVAFE